jgi:hypothetical protein
MNEFFCYFQKKYSYTKEDLISVFGKEFNSFYENMENLKLINPSEKNLSSMEKKIDEFMDEMTYSNRRRRRG